MKIATWNLNSYRRDPNSRASAWRHLQSLDVDIALVQEAKPPAPDLLSAMRTYPDRAEGANWWIGTTRRWGSAIAVFNPEIKVNPIEIRPLHDSWDQEWQAGVVYASHPGTFAVAELIAPGRDPFVVVSAYGLITDWNPDIREGYSTTSVNRMLSDLTPLIDSSRGRDMLLAGDFNSGTQWQPGMRQARWGPWHNAMLSRIEVFGFRECIGASVSPDRGPLEGCPCGPAPDCRHVRTLRQGNDPNGAPIQVDLVYAKGTLCDDLVKCEAQNTADDPAWALSDHCPVIAEFKD